MFLIVVMLVSYFPLNIVLASEENLDTNIVDTNTITETKTETSIQADANSVITNDKNTNIETPSQNTTTVVEPEDSNSNTTNNNTTITKNDTENIENIVSDIVKPENTVASSNTIVENTTNTDQNTTTTVDTQNNTVTNTVNNSVIEENELNSNNAVENDTTIEEIIPEEQLETSSDLANFVFNAKLLDISGNEVAENIKIEDNYKIKIDFTEQANKQFKENENGVMTYQLPSSITLINDVLYVPLTILNTETQENINVANYSVDKTNNIVTVIWNKIDVLGNQSENYFFENCENTIFSFEFDVKISSNNEENMIIDFGNNINLNITFLTVKNEEEQNNTEKIEAKDEVDEIELKLTWQELLEYGPYITMVIKYAEEYGEQPSKEELEIYRQYRELVYGKGSELAAIAMFQGTQGFTEEELAVYEAYKKIIENGGEESPIQTLSIDVPGDYYNGKKVLSVRRTDGWFLGYLCSDNYPAYNEIKYIASTDNEKPTEGTRLAYCMNYDNLYEQNAGYDEETWSNRVTNSKFGPIYKKLYSELSYAISIGCKTYGSHNSSEFSTNGNWEEDYFVTQTVIYIILDDYINNIDAILTTMNITLTEDEKIELSKQLAGDETLNYPKLFSGHSYSSLSLNTGETNPLYGGDRPQAVYNAVTKMYNHIKDYRVKTNGNSSGYDSSIVATPSIQTLSYQKDSNGNEYYVGSVNISTTGTMVSKNITLSGPTGITSISFDGTTCTFKIPASSISNYTSNQQFEITFSADFKKAKTVTYLCEIDDAQSIAFFQDEKNETVTESVKVKVQKEEVAQLKGAKTWNDNGNSDKRPSSITINLLENGVIKESKIVTANDNWEWSFTVPKKDVSKYTISENNINGYTTSINGYNVTNTLITTQVNGNKNWSDHNNKHNTRPESITVNLFADGAKVSSKTVTKSNATNDNQWAYSFTNLPKYNKDGSEIKYTVTEEPVIGYDTTINGYIINNCLVTINISGVKTWVDFNNLHNKRPESITVILLANGKKYDEKIVTADSEINGNQWAYTFENLPKYDKKTGKEIKYEIKENSINGYQPSFSENSITNALITTQINGTKIWEDFDNVYGTRPESVQINLFADGTKVDEMIVTAPRQAIEQLSESDTSMVLNNWDYEFKNLPKYNTDGTVIVYTVTEEPIIGYNPEITEYTVKNKLETTEVTVTKNWEDFDNSDNTRPDAITIHLYADGEELKVQTINAPEDNLNEWIYTFENLPKYNKTTGELVVYTITEDDVIGYTSSIADYNVVNTLITTEVSGTKTWKDNNNFYQTRPDCITLNLFANGVKIREQIISSVNSGNVWNYTFTDIPKYDKTTGEEIIYTVTENPIEKYKTQILEDGITLINTLSEKTTISGDKCWHDENNAYKLRPQSITVNLFANGKFYVSQKVKANAKGDWVYSFTNLEKYDEEGVMIEYTITESPVDRYSTDIRGYSIINTLIQDHVDFGTTEYRLSELDSTPKTGRKNEIPFFSNAAIISLIGIILLRKKEQK